MSDKTLVSPAGAAAPGIRRRTGLWAALLALLSGCSTTDILDRLVPSDSYQAELGVAYGVLERQRLDVYRPLQPGPGAAPLVVFFYGGSWTSGQRSEYRFVGEALASRGVVTVVADYRLSPQVRYPEFVRDAALAVRWAHEHAARLGADPRRLHVMGHSAGAYNAAMVALDARWLGELGQSPALLAGFIGLAGPYEFLPIGVPEVQVAFDWPHTQPESQPVNHVSAGAPRTLLIAPRNDTLVGTRRNTEALGRLLQAQGVDTTVQVLDGVSHITLMGAMARPLNFLAPVAEQVVRFVQQNPPAPLSTAVKAR